VDYAGNVPTKLVVVGTGDGSLLLSSDSGSTWTTYPGSTPNNGKLTITANGTSIVFSGSNGVSVATNNGAFVASTGVPSGAVVEADKANDAYVSLTSLWFITIFCSHHR
jgi:xyloglucan-specific exo-beta-1,4-glucanase